MAKWHGLAPKLASGSSDPEAFYLSAVSARKTRQLLRKTEAKCFAFTQVGDVLSR